MINHKQDLQQHLSAFLDYLYDKFGTEGDIKQDAAKAVMETYINSIPHHNIIGSISDLETFIRTVFLSQLEAQLVVLGLTDVHSRTMADHDSISALRNKIASYEQIILKTRELNLKKETTYTKDQVYRILANFALNTNTDAYCGGEGNTTDIAADLKNSDDIDFTAPEITR